MAKRKDLWGWLILFVIVLIAFNIAFFGQQNGDEESIKIGVSIPLTGPAAFTGETYLDGLEVAQKEINEAGGINGKRIELFVEDNQNSGKEGVNAFRALEVKSPDLIISTTSAGSVTLSPLAEEAGIPLLVSIIFADVLTENENAVAFFPTAQDDARATVADMKRNGIERVGVLYWNSEFGKANLDAFAAEAEKNGIELISVEPFVGDANDFMTPLIKIEETGPEAVYIIAINSIPIVKHLKNTQSSMEIYSNLIPVFGSLIYRDEEAYDGVHLTAPKVSIEGTEEYNEFRNIVGDFVDLEGNSLGYVSIGYDNLHAVANVLKDNDNVNEFVSSFSTYGIFEGINGEYNLEGRNIGMQLHPVVFEDGKVKEVL